MATIDDYVDAARLKQRLPSDRQLAIRLHMTDAGVNGWRRKRTWPSDETMMKLAALAGIDEAQALLDLNQWRSQSLATRSAYALIAERLKATEDAAA